MTNTKKIPDKLVAAMARYFSHYRATVERNAIWDKDADLRAIDKIRRSVGASSFLASAGTFWFQWKRPLVETKHDDSCIEGYTTRRKVDGRWVELCDLIGTRYSPLEEAKG